MTRFSIGYTIVILLVLQRSLGQKFKFGPCQNIPAYSNFNPTTFANTWYEYSRIQSYHEHVLRCNSLTFTYMANSNTFLVALSGFRVSNGVPINALGTATLPSGVTVGTLSVTYPNSVFSWYKINYNIVAIDPAFTPQWAVIHSCKDFGIGRIENIIVITSVRQPSAATITAAYTSMNSLGLDTTDLTVVNQINC